MDIINKIKEKKELSGIPDNTVKESLEKQLRKLNLPDEGLSKKDEKILIKEVRKTLREYVGRFKSSGKDQGIIKRLVESNQINPALMLHSSTRERMNFYPELKKVIKKLSPGTILDLGCGLNPLALADKSCFYYASDIDENNLRLIKRFFHLNNIKGQTFTADLRKAREFPEADLCLILKVLDILKMPHKEVESLLLSLKCRTLIVSFSTVTLSGKQMKDKRRFWFERILERLNIPFEDLESNNEFFYIISLGARDGRP